MPISRMGLSPESRRVIRKGPDIGKLVLKGLGIVRKVGKGVRKIIKPREIPHPYYSKSGGYGRT